MTINTINTPTVIEIVTRGPVGAGGALGYYLSSYDTTDQPILNTTLAQPILINTVLESSGISIEDGSKITFSEHATYSFTFSIQFTNNSNSIQTATVWLKYKGVDYPYSSSHFDIPAIKAGKPGSTVGTVNFVATSENGGGDYVELYWAGTSTALKIDTFPAGINPVYPVAPGVILTVTQVMYLQAIAP